MQLNMMNTAAEEVCEIMGLLSNKSRLMLLCMLIDGERSVGQLAERLDAKIPAVSQQLAVLRHQKLVTPRREGKTIFYSLADARIQRVLETLYALYCGDDIQREEHKP